MKTIALHIIFFITLLCTLQATAQQPAYTYYSIRNGLSSNDTYNCVQDKRGFLWIATENGVVKFDGKTFKPYTTKEGVPDNDVLVVDMDNNGVIWILPFQKTPAYYDEKKDKFINSNIDDELQKIKLTSVNNCNALVNGGMAFCNSKGSFFIYKNNKCDVVNINSYGFPKMCTRIIALPNEKYMAVCDDSLRTYKNGLLVNSVVFNRKMKRTTYVNNCLYVADSTTLFKMQILPNGSIGEVKNIVLPFKIVGLNFTSKQIAISSATGNIYFADTATLAFSPQGFSFNALIRFIYEDNASNTWICSRENGLIRYQQKGILTISDDAYKRNFNTICFWNNKLTTGTNEGEIYVYNSTYDFKIIQLGSEKNYASWIRRIIPLNDKLLVGAEGGLYRFNKQMEKEVLFTKTQNVANKDFIILDDSTLICGNSGAARRINLKKLNTIDSVNLRATALAAAADKNIYIGSNIGLYHWQNYTTNNFLGSNNALLANRISALKYNNINNVLWVGLAIDTIVALQNNKQICAIPMGSKLPGNECRAIHSKKNGQVWIGTNEALARIDYSFVNEKLDYKINVFTTADGIVGKQINDITEHNDTIYVVTNAGVSILPTDLNFSVLNIPTFITNVKINNADTLLQNTYSLSYNQNNISVNFSSANLGTSIDRYYEYAINKEAWVKISIENITLPQLSAGNYLIKIRALNRDGNPSNIIAEINFEIKAAFWKSWWFWLLATLAAGGLVFYYTQKNNRIKREQAVQKLLTEKKLSELELRALKAQINPHFVFNCLNSIKYLNHQNKKVETDIYLDKFSYLLRKTLDFSGLQKIPLEEELAYSKNYLALEKLRLGDKLNYEIKTDSTIDTTKTMVPPMLLQPYLENAVKHGIRHLEGNKGLIEINIKDSGTHIICTVLDNGVGIENAKNKNKMNNPNHISHGTTLQQRRVELYDIKVNTSNGENNIGTIVTLTIKKEETI